MLIKVKSVAFSGINVLGVDVEINISGRGLPAFDIVGLPSKAVDESRHRVKSAIQNCGFEFPNKKITVNLAPADIHKEGSFYDLAIAIGIICVSRGSELPDDSVFFGELSLAGELRHTKGVFLAGLFALENHYKKVVVPSDSLNETAALKDVMVFGFDNLLQVFDYFSGKTEYSCNRARDYPEIHSIKIPEGRSLNVENKLEDIAGQDNAKRALIISAAGGHHIHLVGSPGVGKTMLAYSMAGILPPLSYRESVEVTKIYSASGKILPNEGLITRRPFRAPHHTVSFAGMIGGGVIPAAGEVTLAHRGVLFLDEFPEFSRQVMETLRQPLETGKVTISRGRGAVEFPARFTLITASNPCKCGYYNDDSRQCVCTEAELNWYRKRISGPIMDRIDLYSYCKAINHTILNEYLKDGDGLKTGSITSERAAGIICSAREIQNRRYVEKGILCNSEMTNQTIREYCGLAGTSSKLWEKMTGSFRISNRAALKILKVSRTIADMEGCEQIGENHLLEAFQYRLSGVVRGAE